MPDAVRLEVHGGVARIVLDVPGRNVNVLDEDVLNRLDRRIREVGERDDVSCVLLVSGKERGFCAGADVERIAACRDASEGTRLSRRGQEVFGRLERLRPPVVAAVSGACLGGGLELALACRAIVAAEEPATRLGLPETRLGIVPGFGGTQRLPRRVGCAAALDLILSGRTLGAREALRFALVDDAVPEAVLLDAADRLARDLAAGRCRPRRRRRLWDRGPFRPFLLRAVRARVRRRGRGLYPALEAAIDLVALAARGSDAGYEAEAEAVGRLLAGETSHRLIDLYLHTRAATAAARREGGDFRGERIAVVGAGVMGAGIAELAARKGLTVRLLDAEAEALSRGLSRLVAAWEKRRRRGRATRRQVERMRDRVHPGLGLTGLARVAAVVEAIVEREDAKRSLLVGVEETVGEGTALFTNTSSLRVDRLADALASPDRFCGLHFFNPVDRMPLVEVVRGPRSSPGVVARARALAAALGKTPIVVEDAPGFCVNRILARTFAEALLLLEEGAEADSVDEAMLDWGFVMGPLAVLDTVGLDVAEHAAEALAADLGERLARPQLARRLVERGWLGRKTGRGIRGGRRGRSTAHLRATLAQIRRQRGVRPRRPSREEIRDRLVAPLLDEAVRTLDAGIVSDARDLDAALVLGAGFPAAKGGPIAVVERMGAGALVSTLESLARRLGPRFEPGAALRRRAGAETPEAR